MLKFFIILLISILLSCQTNSNKQVKTQIKAETNKTDSSQAIISNHSPDKTKSLYISQIDSAFNKWKSNEIKSNRMQAKCPEYGTKEFENFMQVSHDNDERFAYTKTLKKLYTDFNEDGIQDGLIVFERQDCEQGSGYVGDYEVSVIFVSSGNTYIAEPSIIKNMHKAINSKALNIFMPQVAYIEVHTVEANNIKGTYYDWQEEDASGQPSVKKNFTYNFKTRALHTQE